MTFGTSVRAPRIGLHRTVRGADYLDSLVPTSFVGGSVLLSILFFNTRNRWLAPSLPMGHLSALQVLRGAAGHLSFFWRALYSIDFLGVETSPLPSRFW